MRVLALGSCLIALFGVCGCASSASRAPRAHSGAAAPAAAPEAAPRALADDLWPARVLALLNEHRHDARVAPLAPSAALSEVAAEAARACFTDATFDEQGVLAHAHARLERQALLYRRVSAVVTLADSPADAAELEAALDPDARNVGIGVARGAITGSRGQRTAIVLVLATPRDGEANP